MEAVGIDVDRPVSQVADSICKAGIGLFNGMSPGSPSRRPGDGYSPRSVLVPPLTLRHHWPIRPGPRQALWGVYNRDGDHHGNGYGKNRLPGHGMVVHGVDQASGLGMDEPVNLALQRSAAFRENSRKSSAWCPKIWDWSAVVAMK